ncbi:MAG: EamA family transporter [Comamonadaceae bacterium CG_4_9_14_0_8_um_filter_57_21]|nr:DMT family transporter [Rhodoferax sp.]NCS61752.1 DMT family transporter [Rhodoferax sp.]PJC15996.1 MAG: EamA family transporter [Comamonadaceae bacterium CG_4_9_14_0_8_um_filter_57_21]
MMSPYDLFALGAAVCWAVGSVMSVAPSRHLGAFAFTRWRMLMVAFMLWAVVAVNGSWHSFDVHAWGVMAVSGLVGIFIGDTALFSAINRLGPRRAGVLFATHAAFSAALGFIWLGERMSLQAFLGAVLTLAGVMLAIVLGRHKNETHAWEADHGHIGLGVALALVAALCQAVGSLIAKPVMATQVDPVMASAVRVTVATVAHFVLLAAGFRAARAQQTPTLRVLAQTGLNGFIAMGIGMTLVLLALEKGDVGMVAILSSVSPILVLPLLWFQLKRAPALGAWVGASLTVVGTALILWR